MVSELGDEHMCQQTGSRNASFDRTSRSWRLHDGAAAEAANFGRTRRIMRKRAGTNPSCSATSSPRWLRLPLQAGQFFVGGRYTLSPRGRCPGSGLCGALTRCVIGRRHSPFSLCIVCLQVFYLQSQLLNLMIELLGFAVERHAPQLDDPQFQMLDLGGTRVQLRLQAHDLFFARQQQRLQGIEIVEELSGSQHGLSFREGEHVCEADVGRQIRSGCCQAIPKSSIDNRAWVR